MVGKTHKSEHFVLLPYARNFLEKPSPGTKEWINDILRKIFSMCGLPRIWAEKRKFQLILVHACDFIWLDYSTTIDFNSSQSYSKLVRCEICHLTSA